MVEFGVKWLFPTPCKWSRKSWVGRQDAAAAVAIAEAVHNLLSRAVAAAHMTDTTRAGSAPDDGGQTAWAAEQAKIRTDAKQFVLRDDFLHSLFVLYDSVCLTEAAKQGVLAQVGKARAQAKLEEDAAQQFRVFVDETPSSSNADDFGDHIADCDLGCGDDDDDHRTRVVASTPVASRHVVTDQFTADAPIKKFLETVCDEFTSRPRDFQMTVGASLIDEPAPWSTALLRSRPWVTRKSFSDCWSPPAWRRRFCRIGRTPHA